MGLPGVRVTPERVELIPRCQGEGKIAAIIGPSGVEIESGEDMVIRHIEFYDELLDYYDDLAEGGRLLGAVAQFFYEARLCHDIERCPVEHLYVIDIGATDNLDVPDIIDRYLQAVKLIEDSDASIDLEAYVDAGDLVGLDSVEHGGQQRPNAFVYLMQQVDQHLYKSLHGDPAMGYSNFPQPITAIAPTPKQAGLEDIKRLTDPSEGSGGYIRSSRVALYDNPVNLAGFAGLVSGTYPWENPGKYTYKTVSADTIIKRPWSELVQLKEAGINCDWLFKPRSATRYGPVWPVMTSYRKDLAGQRPVDSTIYARAAIDHVLKQIIEVAASEIYEMATQDAVNMVKSSGQAIIAKNQSQGTIRNGTIEAYINSDSPNVIDIELTLTPPESVEEVVIQTSIMAAGSYIEE